MNADDIVHLPFEVQAVLAAGYLGYRLAAAGLDRTHRAADTVFQVFVYGALAWAACALAKPHIGVVAALAVAFPTALVAAALWRAGGRRILVAALRWLKVTRENYAPSTWDSIIHAPHAWTHLSVMRTDDVIQESNLGELAPDLPLDRVDVDAGGNVALYVTRTIAPDGKAMEHGSGRGLDDGGRARLTYIPAENIKQVTVSFANPVPSEAPAATAAATASG